MNPLMVIKTNGIRRLAMGESGPEKAGVGGSIPSLATTPTAYLTRQTDDHWSLCDCIETASVESKWSPASVFSLSPL